MGNYLPMRHLFENLLIHEVVTISGAARPSAQKWIDSGLLPAPPVVGKHRRFAAEHTVEMILMAELSALGVKPSAISKWLAQLTYPLLHYIDECAADDGYGGIILTQDCVLRLWLDRGGDVINVVQLDDTVKTAELPQYSLVMRCGPVFAAALRRAKVLHQTRSLKVVAGPGAGE